MMRKRSLFLFLLLILLVAIVLVLFYRFAQWYEQIFGAVFSYVLMFSFVLFMFAPFRFMKDKKVNISIITYLKYLGVTILVLLKFVLRVIKQSLLTLSYIISRFFAKSDIQEK